MSNPSLGRYLQVFSTAGCSTFVVMMWLPLSFFEKAVPFMAWLSPSVPELVKISSRGAQLRRAHTRSLASSTAFLVPLPAQCMDEGLPHNSFRYGTIA